MINISIGGVLFFSHLIIKDNQSAVINIEFWSYQFGYSERLSLMSQLLLGNDVLFVLNFKWKASVFRRASMVTFVWEIEVMPFEVTLLGQ